LEQIGVVNKVYNNIAQVQIKRTTACGGKCGECGGCEVTSQKVEALNTVGAKVGQVVQMEMNDTQILFAAFLVYIIPLVMLFIGYLAGYSVFSSEFAAGVSGVLLLIISFLVLRKMDKKLARSGKYQIKITKILS
jgi:sigma-E factor negative regulatory protein RseC